jgi:hypothetical protein
LRPGVARQAKRDAAFLVGRCRQARCSRAASAIFNFAATRGLLIFNLFIPSLMKPIEGYSILLKPFFKNPFFAGKVDWVPFPTSAFQFLPGYASLCQLPSRGPIERLSQIQNFISRHFVLKFSNT